MSLSHALFVAAATLIAASAACAKGAQCHTFGEQRIGHRVAVGEAVHTERLTLHVSALPGVGGTPPGVGDLQVSAEEPVGREPTMRIRRVMAQLRPHTMAREVTLELAQPVGAADFGIQVNGTGHTLVAGLVGIAPSLAGELALGPGSLRWAFVPATDAGPAGWRRGTLSLRAVSGGIHTIGLGGDDLVFDNVCFLR